MNNSIKQALIVNLFILLTITAGFGQSDKPAESFDYGNIEKNVYRNDYFGLNITFDTTWFVKDKKQKKEMREAGKKLITGDDKVMKAVIKASEVNVANIFTIFKYEHGAPVDFNPSFAAVAENIKKSPGIKNGKDYLFHVRKFLKLSQLKHTFEKEIYQRKIGSKKFWVLETNINYLGQVIKQEYIYKIFKRFTLSFIMAYNSEEQKKELYQLLKDIEFK